jgi:hypothetical protein
MESEAYLFEHLFGRRTPLGASYNYVHDCKGQTNVKRIANYKKFRSIVVFRIVSKVEQIIGLWQIKAP